MPYINVGKKNIDLYHEDYGGGTPVV